MSVVLPEWVVGSGEVHLSVGERWRPALVAERSTELAPAGERDGIDGLSRKDVPAADGGTSRRPEYGWVASSVATVPVDERVEAGRMVGHLPMTAMDAGGVRFAVGGTYEGRWRCSACTLEHLPHLLDETSPVFAAMGSLLVVRIVRFGLDGSSRSSEVSDTGSRFVEGVSHYVVDVQP